MLARSVPLVRLTRPDGQPILVNINEAIIIMGSRGLGYADDAHTVLIFDGHSQAVKESFNEVCALLGIT